MDYNKAIFIKVDEELFNTIDDIMKMKLKGKNRTYMSMHSGSKQQWYRELLEIGIMEKIKDFEKKKKDFEDNIKEDVL